MKICIYCGIETPSEKQNKCREHAAQYAREKRSGNITMVPKFQNYKRPYVRTKRRSYLELNQKWLKVPLRKESSQSALGSLNG